MISFPPCKINLGLSVTAKRPDGYHDLETGFYPIPWTDILEIIPSQKTEFTTSGNIIPGNPHDNLCMKAYTLLKKDHDLPPVAIHLHKVLPTGAGLGGGSADGAHTLRLLNTMFGLNLSTEKLMVHAASLGSDCAFFIQDKPMIGTGRGDILSYAEVNLAGKFIVLIKPPFHVSTADAYAGITPRKATKSVKAILETTSPDEWRSSLKNDFEESVFRKYPMIGEIKDYLYHHGATYACMSGSGSAVFGIFEHPVVITVPTDHVIWSGIL